MVSNFFYFFYFYLQTCEEDVSQFDQRFTKETPIDSPCDKMLSESVDQIFQVSDFGLNIHFSFFCSTFFKRLNLNQIKSNQKIIFSCLIIM